MDTTDFFRVLATFADDPSSVERKGNTFAISTRSEVLSGSLTRGDSGLVVEEDGHTVPATTWIARRLARLDTLAERLDSKLSALEDVQTFVSQSADLLGELGENPNETEQLVDNSLESLRSILDRRPAGLISVSYLTSGAGEGKTTLIHRLAAQQAKAFKERRASWMLVPVALGGRPFLRFDDVVVGALANNFRFLELYYQSFVELVRLGFLVPAFDGFEEMFVESSSGEAVSALGSLLRDLRNEGSLLIAAREAYFELRQLDAQARLFDSLPDVSLSSSRLRLRRWDRRRFVDYGVARALTDTEAEQIYETVARRLPPSHPLLTRPVLAHRVYEVADDAGDVEAFAARLDVAETKVFAEFVNAILEREATKKWLDRSGPSVAAPLLTVSQHEELLAAIAREMWISRTELLATDIVQLTCELSCEALSLDARIRRQVAERIGDHALLRRESGATGKLRFDHEEFYHYFLGRTIALALTSGPDFRDLMRRGSLPGSTIAAVADRLVDLDSVKSIDAIVAAMASEPPSSFARENAGALVCQIIRSGRTTGLISVTGLIFPHDGMIGLRVDSAQFRRCTFQRSSFEGAALRGVSCAECVFEAVESFDLATATNLTIDETSRVHSCQRSDAEVATYEPQLVREELSAAGWRWPAAPQLSIAEVIHRAPDATLKVVLKSLKAFARSTEVNENTLRQRAGIHANKFVNECLPDLTAAGIVVAVKYRGEGSQERYKLRAKWSEIEAALRSSGGDYGPFVHALGRLVKQR